MWFKFSYSNIILINWFDSILCENENIAFLLAWLDSARLSWDVSHSCRLHGYCFGCAFTYFRPILSRTWISTAFHEHSIFIRLLAFLCGGCTGIFCVYFFSSFAATCFCSTNKMFLFWFRPERPSFGFRMRVGFIDRDRMNAADRAGGAG